MAYINGGCEGFKTKSALKIAVKSDPSAVYFYCTSPLGQTFNGKVSDMPEGVTLQVVGPDPYNNRSWYASIKRGPRGITCS